jgi:uncharacterized protein
MSIEYLNLSWTQIEESCKDIAKKIKTANYNPDMIIAVGRGGLIPSRILSDILNIHDVLHFPVSFYRGVNNKLIKPRSLSNFSHNVRGKKILLVDDLIDSGGTAEFVISDLNMKGSTIIRYATIICKDDVKRKPTFYSFSCKQDVWVVFPWEKEEFKKGAENG